MDKKKILIISLIFIVVLSAVLILSKKISVKEKSVGLEEEKTKNCEIKEEKIVVRGNSLEPLIKDGQEVRALIGYYDCNEIKRDDIVLYFYVGSKEPLIKIVKGIPGDKFALEKTMEGWHILINGKVLVNSEGKPYLISERGYKVLSLYEKDYKNTIPEDAYLILGNLPTGSFDSTEFGLVGRKEILGKVEK
jgi:signal peptidase I